MFPPSGSMTARSWLAPASGTPARYRLQEWLNYITSELHKSVGSLFNSKMPKEWQDQVKEGISGRFDFLSKQLGGKSYLTGDTFTVADGYLYTILTWTGHLGIDLGKWPVLKAYVDRVSQRPAVQAALKAEGLAAWSSQSPAAGVTALRPVAGRRLVSVMFQ
jgi:glutathione S-transferase